MHYWNNLLLAYIILSLPYWSNLLQFPAYFILYYFIGATCSNFQPTSFYITLLEQSAPISNLLHFTITLLEQGEYGLWSFVCLGEHGGAGL